VRLVPLTEGRGVDLDDAALDERVRADKLCKASGQFSLSLLRSTVCSPEAADGRARRSQGDERALSNTVVSPTARGGARRAGCVRACVEPEVALGDLRAHRPR